MLKYSIILILFVAVILLTILSILFSYEMIDQLQLKYPKAIVKQNTGNSWRQDYIKFLSNSNGISHFKQYGFESQERLKDSHRITSTSYIVCSESDSDLRFFVKDKPQIDYEHLPIIYFVTFTKPMQQQVPNLVRLAHTLLHVPRLHWLIIDEYGACNRYLTYLLSKFGLPYTHMCRPLTPFPSRDPHEPINSTQSSEYGRFCAIVWLRKRYISSGILHFSREDTIYDLNFFTELRHTQGIAAFPIAINDISAISSPVVDRNGRITGFLNADIIPSSGYAISLTFLNTLIDKSRTNASELLLKNFDNIFVNESNIQPLVKNCSEVYVWETEMRLRTMERTILQINSKLMNDETNLGELMWAIRTLGIAGTSNANDSRTQLVNIYEAIKGPN